MIASWAPLEPDIRQSLARSREPHGSALLAYLISERRRIKESWLAQQKQLPKPSPTARVVFAALAPNVRPPTLEARLREVDALRGTLPWNDIRKMIDCIVGSAQDSGEVITKVYEPLPRRIALSGKPTISEIQKFVAHHFAMTQSDILSARRTANVVRPRQIAMYLSKLLTPRSFPEIGRRFGDKDHTTVLHAVRKISALVDADKALAEEIAILKKMLLA